jgi:hypothetical protein
MTSMDTDPGESQRPDQPLSRALDEFAVAVGGWIAALDELDRFFQPLVAATPALEEQLRIIYLAHLGPWRARIDALLPELAPNLVGKRQTVRRIAFQRRVRSLLVDLERAASRSLAEIFPASKGDVPALAPIPGLNETTRRFIGDGTGNGSASTSTSPRDAESEPQADDPG